jgi:type I site-specific restriction endonuclease
MNMKKLVSKIAHKIDPPPPPRTTGYWVIGLSGQLIWDPWDFPEPTEEEAAATLTSLTQRLEDMAAKARAQPDWTEPSEQQKAEATRRLEEKMESYRAQKAAVRAFTAKVERERAERTAMTNLHGNRRFLCRISYAAKESRFLRRSPSS